MQEEFEKMSLVDLCDLLVDKTTELLKLMEQKTKGDGLQNLKKEVEQIQAEIKARKANLSEGLFQLFFSCTNGSF